MDAPATLADIESLIEDSMLKLKEIHAATMNMQTILVVLPDINTMIKAMVTSQTVMASAAQSMADTFAKAEKRQSELEESNTKLYEHKGVSNSIFSMVVGTLLFVIACLILWITGLNAKGSYKDFEIGQRQENINKSTQESIKNLENK